jgi:hypothetical protein
MQTVGARIKTESILAESHAITARLPGFFKNTKRQSQAVGGKSSGQPGHSPAQNGNWSLLFHLLTLMRMINTHERKVNSAAKTLNSVD